MSNSNIARSEVLDLPLEDPPTMMSLGVIPVPDNGNKKTNKKKRQQAKLEMQADELRRSGAPFDYFLSRMERWLKRNNSRLTAFCHAIDVENEGAVTHDEFKSCLFDLGSPCNTVEAQLLCTLLDPKEQQAIAYQHINDGLLYIRELAEDVEASIVRQSIVPTVRSFAHCPTCTLPLWDGCSQITIPRYVMLELRLVTFDGTAKHPGHINFFTHSHIAIQGVMNHIREATGLLSTKLAVFRDMSRSLESMLLPESTLEDLGFLGGPHHHPEEQLLFYDYIVEFADCPLLLCDHYI